MSAENLSGAIFGNRQGGVPVTHSKRFAGQANTDPLSTGIIINATVDSPVWVEAQVIVTTADSGTTPTMSLGFTGANYTDLVNAASTATAATNGTFLPAANATGKVFLTARTEIFSKQGGTPNGTGVTWFIITVTNLNPR